jgi:hypothetical protein
MADEGGRASKGLAARQLGGAGPAPDAASASLRHAAQRATRRAAATTAATEAEPPGAAAAPEPPARAAQRAARARQAALGMLGGAGKSFDPDAITAWLRQLSAAEQARLAGLLRQARGPDAKDATPPPFERIERQLAQQGVHLEIHDSKVTVTVGGPGGKRAAAPAAERDGKSGRRSGPRLWSRVDWGRHWGHIRDFINGH